VRPASCVLALFFFTGCLTVRNTPIQERIRAAEKLFGAQQPLKWSETLEGVETRIPVSGKQAVLTLDACGSDGDGYDRELIDFLREQQIPASLFINARWIRKNPRIFEDLARDPLFTIENHGTEHRPASVNGRSAYGIRGTRSASELAQEVLENALEIEHLTGRRPLFYRSGTAYYDEIAVRLIHSLGFRIAGFDILGDRGASYSAAEVEEALLGARPGSLIILHMNHPESGTAEGVRRALPQLKKAGFSCVNLEGLPPKADGH